MSDHRLLAHTHTDDENRSPIQHEVGMLSEYLLHAVISLACEAGEAIMAVYRGGDAGEIRKADDSPLTLADLVSQRTIVAGLTRLTPECPIISEEATDIPYVERNAWTRYWLVDPLDGTKEFIKRNGEFTVNIALIENGAPILGVVYAPALDRCYFAMRGAGAFVQCGASAAQPIRAKQQMTGEPVKVIASRSHNDERTVALLERLGDFQCVSMGSSLKLCMVAEGVAHFYPRFGPTMEWDTAAAHIVVNEAGGVVCDSSGSELMYNKQDMHNPEFFVQHAMDKQLYKTL